MPTRIADTGMSSRIACACSITQSVSSGCAGLAAAGVARSDRGNYRKRQAAERGGSNKAPWMPPAPVGSEASKTITAGTAGFLVGIECRGYHGPARPEAPEGVRKWGKIRRILSAIQRIQTIPMSAPDYKTYMCLIAVSSTTKPQASRMKVSSPVPSGPMCRPTGPVPNAAPARKTSKWWKSDTWGPYGGIIAMMPLKSALSWP